MDKSHSYGCKKSIKFLNENTDAWVIEDADFCA
jgi:hypothetical protein